MDKPAKFGARDDDDDMVYLRPTSSPSGVIRGGCRVSDPIWVYLLRTAITTQSPDVEDVVWCTGQLQPACFERRVCAATTVQGLCVPCFFFCLTNQDSSRPEQAGESVRKHTRGQGLFFVV